MSVGERAVTRGCIGGHRKHLVDLAHLQRDVGQARHQGAGEVIGQGGIRLHLLVQRGRAVSSGSARGLPRRPWRRTHGRSAWRARRRANRVRSASAASDRGSGTRTASPDTMRYAPSPGVPASVMMLPRRKAMRSAWRAISVSCSGFKPENRGTRSIGAITLSIAMASNLIDADFPGSVGQFAPSGPEPRCGQGGCGAQAAVAVLPLSVTSSPRRMENPARRGKPAAWRGFP